VIVIERERGREGLKERETQYYFNMAENKIY